MREGVGLRNRSLEVVREVLAVQIDKLERCERLARLLGHVAGHPERMRRAKEEPPPTNPRGKFRERKKGPLCLTGLLAPIEIEDFFHRAEHERMAALCTFTSMPGKTRRPFTLKASPSREARRHVGIHLVESERVEMLGEAYGIESGRGRLAKEPIGVRL